MRFTLFPDQFAQTKTEHDETWRALCHRIVNAPEYADKASLPFISLAVYGDTPNENGCLRYADNIRAITGLEGDYDGERVTLAQAAQMARDAGLRACFYTSASHTLEAPRWRILVPLSQERALADRSDLMDRLNGMLGGILNPESWTHSQAFLFGRVSGVPYEVAIV